jgi:tetratricopeptide (TPR) repeat protein
MKARVLLLSAVVLSVLLIVPTWAQNEGGGGGVKPSNTSDTTYRRKFPTPAKRTVPKRIAARKTAAEYESEGDRLYDQKDYDSALLAYQAAAKLKPTYRSMYRIGWLQNDFGQYSAALAALDRAIAIDSTQSGAYTEKGYAHRRLNQFPQAIAAFQRSISLYPEGYVAPYELGSIYSEQKNYSEAERYLLQSIRNNSENANAYEELGVVQRRQGRDNEAIRSFNRAISLDPQASGAYMGLGDVYFYNKEDYASANDAYLKGLELDPDNRVAAYNVGYGFNDMSRFTDAIPWLQKAIKLKADYVEARAELGFAQLKLKRFPAALTTLRTAVSMNNNFDTSHYYLGQVYVLTGDRQGAMNEYRELQRLHSTYAGRLMDMINKM